MPREDTQFKKGQPGGPGRPKGARNKLCNEFLRVLSEDFEKHGEDVVNRLREEKPDTYVGAIGKLMPKLMEITGKDGDDVKVIHEIKRTIVDGDD